MKKKKINARYVKSNYVWTVINKLNMRVAWFDAVAVGCCLASPVAGRGVFGNLVCIWLSTNVLWYKVFFSKIVKDELVWVVYVKLDKMEYGKYNKG